MTDAENLTLYWKMLYVGLEAASALAEIEPDDLHEIEVLLRFFEASAKSLAIIRDHIRASA